MRDFLTPKHYEQPSTAVVEREKAVPITALFAPKKVGTLTRRRGRVYTSVLVARALGAGRTGS